VRYYDSPSSTQRFIVVSTCTCRPTGNNGKFSFNCEDGLELKNPHFTSFYIFVPGYITGISEANLTYFGLLYPPFMMLSNIFL
jgi:hypothetical protein